MQYNVINENNCGTTQTLPNRAFYLAKNVPPRLKCSKNIEKVWEAHPQNGESPSSRNVFLKEKKGCVCGTIQTYQTEHSI